MNTVTHLEKCDLVFTVELVKVRDTFREFDNKLHCENGHFGHELKPLLSVIFIFANFRKRLQGTKTTISIDEKRVVRGVLTLTAIFLTSSSEGDSNSS